MSHKDKIVNYRGKIDKKILRQQFETYKLPTA